MTDPIAIIPARGGSKRLPRKNVLSVCGRPVIEWTIRTCHKSGIFSDVIVSTDDDEIIQVSKNAGATVIRRPSEMATDTAHESAAYNHVLETIAEKESPPDYFCGVYATAALLSPDDLQNAYKKALDTHADVLMGVSAYPIHPFKAMVQNAKGYLEMVNPEMGMKRSQEYPHYVASNGTFYFMRTQSFLIDSTYYPEKLTGYEIPASRAVDVDTMEDFETLEFMLSHKLSANQS